MNNSKWLIFATIYPNLAKILNSIAYDNGVNPAAFYDENINIDVKDPQAEILAGCLSGEQIELAAAGEETETEAMWNKLGSDYKPLKQYIDFVCYQIF